MAPHWYRGRTEGWRQNPHTEESDPGPDRLDTQTVHRQSGRVLPELRRTAAVRVACQAHQRDRLERLERLCRYITRPALCLERLSTNAAGQIVYTLKNPFRDGTSHVLFSPEDFIARLAALVPRPRINLTRYHGVFAPSSPMRRAIVPTPARARRRKPKNSAHAQATREQNAAEPSADTTDAPSAPLTWAQRLKRVFVRSLRDRHR